MYQLFRASLQILIVDRGLLSIRLEIMLSGLIGLIASKTTEDYYQKKFFISCWYLKTGTKMQMFSFS